MLSIFDATQDDGINMVWAGVRYAWKFRDTRPLLPVQQRTANVVQQPLMALSGGVSS